MNILIVDDEIVQLESLKRGLRSRGYDAQLALGGQDALSRLQDCSGAGSGIDLVITDYAMPVMTGLELLKRIREHYGNLPVIMMTAYGQKELIVEALRYRCDSFIEKPFTLDRLVREIEKARERMEQCAGSGNCDCLLPELIHRIDSPLLCISGSAEMALTVLDKPEEVKRFMERIIQSTRTIVEASRAIMNTRKRKCGTVNVDAGPGEMSD